MKKITALFALVALMFAWTGKVNAQCDETDCYLVIDMHDSYGDGWNGNAISLTQNGVSLGSFTISYGSSETDTVRICTANGPVQFSYVSGNYPSEASFTVTDSIGIEVIPLTYCSNLTPGLFATEAGCPTCFKPLDLALSGDPTATSATVTWTAGTYSEWSYACVTNPAAVTEWQTTTSNSVSLTGLSPDTKYYFLVRSICEPGDTSAPAILIFRTACADLTIDNLPTTVDVSDGQEPTCWSYAEVATSSWGDSYPYVYAYYGAFYMYTYYGPVSVASPLINGSVSDVEVLFTAYGDNDLVIGYATDLTDLSTFVAVDTVPVHCNSFEGFNASFANVDYTGDFYIFVRAPQLIGSGTVYIQTITLREYRDCTIPYNVTSAPDDPVSGEIHVQWEDSVGTAWNVAIGPTGFDPDVNPTKVISTTAKNAIFDELNDENTYDIYVQGVCGGEVGYWSNAPFRTKPNSIFMNGTEPMEVTGCGLNIYDDGGPANDHAGKGNDRILTVYPSDDQSTIHLTGSTSLYSYAPYSGRLIVYEGADTTGYVLLDTYASTTVDLLSEEGAMTIRFIEPTSDSYIGSGFEFYASCEAMPSCRSLRDLTRDDVTGSAAGFSWYYSSTADPDNFEIEVNDLDNDQTYIAGTISGDSREYTLAGLTQRTRYTVGVYPVCNGTRGPGMTNTFRTPCIVGGGAYVGNPESTGNSYYSPMYGYYYYAQTISQSIFHADELEGVDTVNGISLDLVNISGAYGNTVSIDIYLDTTSQEAYSGSYSTYDYIPVDTLKAPVFSGEYTFALGENFIPFDNQFVYDGTSNLVLTIWRHDSNSYTCNYLYFRNTAPGFTAACYGSQYSGEIDPAYGASYNYTTTRANVEFQGPCGDAGCVPPFIQNPIAASNSAVVNWNAGADETEWTVSYRHADSTSWTVLPETFTTRTVTLTGLNAGQQYFVRVTSLCDEEKSAYSTKSFYTECGPTDLPIFQNFDNAIADYSDLTFIRCWSRHDDYGYGTYPYVYSYYSYSGSNSLYMYGYYGSTLISPEINANLADVEVSFYAYNYSSGTSIEIGVATDPTDPSTYEVLGSVELANTSTWDPYFFSLDEYDGNGKYVFLRCPQYYSYIDDLKIAMAPNCRDISSVTVENTTETSIDLTIVDKYDRNNYTIYYGTTDNMTAATQMTSTSKNVTINGLTSGTTYYIWVVAKCSDNESSRIYSTTASTLCKPIVVTAENPYFSEFEDESDIECLWVKNIKGRGVWSWVANESYGDKYSYSGVYALQYAANSKDAEAMLVLPTFDFSGIDTLAQISFYRRHLYNPPTILSVYYRVGVSGEWKLITTIDTTVGSYTRHIATLPSSKGAELYQVAIGVVANGGSVNIDDVTVELASGCRAPSGFAVTEITDRTFTAKWTANDKYPSTRVQYRPATGSINWNARTAKDFADELIVAPLNMATTYEVRANTVCGAGYYSEPTPTVTITTNFCDNNITRQNYSATDKDTTTAHTLFSVAYNYDDMTYGYYSYAEIIVDADKLAGLSTINAISFIPDSANLGSYGGGTSVYIAPTTLNELNQFMYNDSTFVKVFSGDASFTEAGKEVTLFFNTPYEYSGSGNLIIAVHHDNGYDYYYGSDDDIYFASRVVSGNKMYYGSANTSFTPSQANNLVASRRRATNAVPELKIIGCVPVCYEPVVAKTSTSANSISVEWYYENATVELQMKEHSASTWDNPVTVSGDNKYTFNMLPSMTQFDIRLRRDCNSSDLGYSDYVTISATTDTACSIPEGVHATEVGAYTATLDWNNTAVANKWEIHVWNSGFDKYYVVDSKPAVVSGLTPGNSYSVAVRAFCAYDNHVVGEWSEPSTFQNTCQPVTGLQAQVTGQDVKLTWVGGSNNNAYYVAWGPKNFDLNNQMGLEKVTGTTYTITGLKNNNTFSFRVRGVCADDWNSEWSAMVNATVGTEGIDDVEEQNAQFNLQPNPATDRVTISLNDFEGVANVSILSVDGRQVSNFTTAESSYSVDLNEFAAGTYFVRIQTEGWTSVRKLIVK